MKKWFRKNNYTIIGIVTGAIAGFLYWRYWGCTNGKCLIQSNPYIMSAYGGLLGGLIVNLFKKQST